MINTSDKILAAVFYRDSRDAQEASRNALRVKSYSKVFTEDFDQRIWEFIDDYLLKNSKAPSYEILKLELERKGQLALVERLRDLEDIPVFPSADFFRLLEISFEDQRKQALNNVLATAMQINGEVGQKVDGKVLQGPSDACKYLITSAAELAYQDPHGVQLRGNIRDPAEIRATMHSYLQTEQDPGNQVGILTGLDTIDEKTKGIKKGEMWLLAGFSSHGKTTVALNIAHQAIVRGNNIFFMSMEMSRQQIKEILYCIHSGHSKFEGQHPPLKLDDIRYGKLTADAKAFYFDAVLADFEKNSTYGQVHVMQPTTAVTPKSLQAEAELVHHQECEVDLIVPDYAGLMEPDRSFSDWRAGLNSVMKDLKQLARNFAGGSSVALLSPFQTNREGMREAAGNGGVYKDLKCLSDANEADRSSDIVLATFTDDAMKLRNEAVLTHLKGRDTGCAAPVTLHANFASRVVKDVGTDIPDSSEKLLEELDALAGA